MAVYREKHVVDTDVLVIGGGFGGLWAAIKALENGAGDVLIADKGAAAKTGKSAMAAGAAVYFLPELGDNLDEWLKSAFQGQKGLCNQDMVESYFTQSGKRKRELESWGLEFVNPWTDDSFMRMPSRGLGSCMMTVGASHKGVIGGKALSKVLWNRAEQLGVRSLNKIFISDLIIQDGCAMGAIGCHRRTGEFFVFRAKAVIIAAADCSFRGNYCCVESTSGDGFALGYRAGADLNNMEMLCSNIGPVEFNFEGTGPAAQLGAIFLNNKEEDFLPLYYPEGSRAEINKIVQAMTKEKKKGNGPPFYFDFEPVTENYPEIDAQNDIYMKMGGFMPVNVGRLVDSGRSPFKSGVHWNPAIQTLRGGIVTDNGCRCRNIRGLFAAGIAQSLGPGLFNGWSIGRCFWSGATSGRYAAEYIKNTTSSKINSEKIVEFEADLYNRSVNPGHGDISVNEIIYSIQKIIFPFDVSIMKEESSLTRALADLEDVRTGDMPRAIIPDMHEFIKFKETENMLLVADIFLKASIVRRETRVDHCRAEYPEADPLWLKWIIFNKDLNQGYRLEELPWNKYRFKPEDLIEE